MSGTGKERSRIDRVGLQFGLSVVRKRPVRHEIIKTRIATRDARIGPGFNIRLYRNNQEPEAFIFCWREIVLSRWVGLKK